MKEKTRLKAALLGCAFLAIIASVCVYLDRESIVMRCIEGVIAIITIYIGGDSYRKSTPSKPIVEESIERPSIHLFADDEFQDEVEGLNIDK